MTPEVARRLKACKPALAELPAALVAGTATVADGFHRGDVQVPQERQLVSLSESDQDSPLADIRAGDDQHRPASVKTCQELARHANPLLTIGRYSHVRLNDLTGALEALPCPAPVNPEREAEPMKATGTDDTSVNHPENKPRQYPRQLGRETAGLGETSRDANAVIGAENAVFDPCAKTGPGRGDRGHIPQGIVNTGVADAATPTPARDPDSCPADPAPADPGLAAVIHAWPGLPAAIRAGIVAMVDAARERGEP